jgi:putative aldouronate transport system substrate-binding protein
MKNGMSVVFLCVVAALPVSLFAAGGQQNRAGGSTADIGFNPTGYPIVSKPYSFSIMVSKSPLNSPYAEMEVFQQMEEKTGVKIQWIEIASANYTERKNLMLASGDLPDVFMSAMTDSDLLRYGPSGTLLAQEKLIEQYAPRITEIFTKRPEIKKFVTTPDGHIYILPRIQELEHRVNPDNLFINKTWLNKLGLKVPTSYEEFYTVLKAFKEKDPNGNGRKDEIPLSFIGSSIWGSYDIASLFAGFGMYDNNMHLMVDNKKVYFTANTPQFRDAVSYFNRLFGEGLLDPESFTHDQKQYFAKGMEPEMIYGAFISWFDESVVGNERAVNDYVAVPPFPGIDGKRHWNYDPTATLVRINYAITNKMKNPEVAVRWADLCYDWEISFELGYGTWGINLRKEGNRIIQIPPPPGLSADEFRYLHSPVGSAPYAIYEEDFKNLDMTDNHVRKFERLDMYRQYFPSLDELYPKVFFLEDEEAELAIIRTSISDYVIQMRAKFIIGAESTTSGWNSYIRALNQMGLTRYLEIHQKALDRYNATK